MNPDRLPAPIGATLAYLRVSTEDQAAEHKSSLTDQRTAITQLARRLGRTVPDAAAFVDAGVSGGTAEGRPAFMALVQYCEAHPRAGGQPGAVLVLNDSRWGRFHNPDEATYWRMRLERLGWVVRFCEGETEHPLANSILRTIYSGQASAYLEQVKANARRGARACAARGLWLTQAPIGYRRCAARPGQPGRVLEAGQRKAADEETRLVLGPPAEQALIRWIFTQYASGLTTQGRLLRELVVRWPGKRWARGVVNQLLRNPTYLGDVVWCRRPHDPREQAQHRVRPPADWVIARDAHPALVSRELFARVQTVMARKKRETSATAGGYPLSGLLRCAHCGETYVGAGGPRGPVSDPDRYRMYRDKGADLHDGRQPRCPGLSGILVKRLIEPPVVAAIAQVVSSPAVQAAMAAAFDAGQRAQEEAAPEQRRRLEQERGQLLKEQTRLVAAIARGVLPDREARPELARIRDELAARDAGLEQLAFARRRQLAADAGRAELLALAADFTRMAQFARGVELREMIRPWLVSAVVDKVARTIVLAIRTVPAIGPFLTLTTTAGRG